MALKHRNVIIACAAEKYRKEQEIGNKNYTIDDALIFFLNRYGKGYEFTVEEYQGLRQECNKLLNGNKKIDLTKKEVKARKSKLNPSYLFAIIVLICAVVVLVIVIDESAIGDVPEDTEIYYHDPDDKDYDGDVDYDDAEKYLEDSLEEDIEEEEEVFESTPSGYTSVNEYAVYNYMKTLYDQVTNYGENYVPEVHDPQVAEMAASRFGISASEASQIYVNIEMENAGY